MADKDKDDTKETELIAEPQADGSVKFVDPNQTKAQPEGDEDESAEAADNQDEQDERLAQDDDTDAAEDNTFDKTAENRRRRHEKKQRIHERFDRLKAELAARDAQIEQLTHRVQNQETRTANTELASLDNAIKQAAEAYNYYKASAATLINTPDSGAQVLDAQEKMLLASQRYRDLTQAKQAYIQRQNAPSPIDPNLQRLGSEWLSRNSWYTPDGDDEDSALVTAIDKKLHKEGWNPATPAYWEELDKRVKNRLPHRFKQSYTRNQEGSERSLRPVVTGGGRETRNSSGSSGYTLSAERVQALKDAGKWDDPEQRAKAIRSYRKYDQQQANAT